MIIECPLEDPQGTLLGKIRIFEDGKLEGYFSETTSFVKVFGKIARVGMANAIILRPKFIPVLPLNPPPLKKVMDCVECFYSSFNKGGRHKIVKAVALWTSRRNHESVPLCKVCLDHWLDNADDDESLEPFALRFLDARAV